MKPRRISVSLSIVAATAAASGFSAQHAHAAENAHSAPQRHAHTMATARGQTPAGPGGYYTVASGDTLSAIAGKEYGNPGCWPGIWHGNQGKISNPNIIYPGEGLAIPVSCGTQGSAVQTASVSGGTSPEEQGHDSDPDGRPAAPPPAPVSQGGYYNSVLSYGQLENLWVAAGGPPWAESHAAEIAECESGGNRYAYNPSGATGLWQILGQVRDFGRSLTDPWVNAANAVAKFYASGQTFAQWVCR